MDQEQSLDSTELEAARAVALRFLGYSARSTAEVVRRLERAGYERSIIETVIDEFGSRGYLDDRKFANDWIEDRADRKQYGRTRLVAELNRRGVDLETIQAAADAISGDDELARACAAARRKFGEYPLVGLARQERDAITRRISGFLQRRGFGWDTIKQVIVLVSANRE